MWYSFAFQWWEFLDIGLGQTILLWTQQKRPQNSFQPYSRCLDQVFELVEIWRLNNIQQLPLEYFTSDVKIEILRKFGIETLWKNI